MCQFPNKVETHACYIPLMHLAIRLAANGFHFRLLHTARAVVLPFSAGNRAPYSPVCRTPAGMPSLRGARPGTLQFTL